MLGVGKRKAGQDFPLHVGPVVAVGVFEVPHVRGVGDEHAPLVAQEARGQFQPLGEHRAPVGVAVAVGVFQELDFARTAQIERIAVHFHHVHPPVFVDFHRHGVGNQRLGGDEFDREPIGDLERSEGVA